MCHRPSLKVFFSCLSFCFCLVMLTGWGQSAQASNYVVTNTNDTGDGFCTVAAAGDGCSLREAIMSTNYDGGQYGTETITFAAGVTGTINLANALPNIGQPISIQGPGADNLTVNRNSANAFGIFNIETSQTCSFSRFDDPKR